MRDLAELQNQVAPTLQTLEISRQAAAKKRSNTIVWCALLGLGGAALLGIIFAGQVGWWIVAPLVLAAVVGGFIVSSIQNRYANEFKMMVLPPLVRAFGELEYHPGSGISEAEFESAGLFQSPDRFSSEDLISGTIGVTRLHFSEVHAEDRRTRTDSKGNTQTYYVTIFRGLFFVFDFNKDFIGETTLFPEGVSGALGGFGAALQKLSGSIGGHGQLVKLEDPRFENDFVVYGTDQTEARYILSSSLMERFCALKSQMGPLYALFRGGQLILLVSSTKDWFEPPSLGTPLSFEALGNSIRELELATGIVEELDLNTRIWSKK